MVYVLQDVLVVCRDSDMEFWADISDDDSDKELDAVRIYECKLRILHRKFSVQFISL